MPGPPHVSSAPSDESPPAAARPASEIAAELRRAFERAMLDATAEQIARVYDESEQLFSDVVLDDLVAALAVSPRAAHPAQTVVAFTGAVGAEFVTPDTPLTGASHRRESLPFRIVIPVRVGPARLALAAVVEAGRVALVPGATLPGAPGAAAEPVPLPTMPVPLQAGDDPHAPTLLLAMTYLPHLPGVSL